METMNALNIGRVDGLAEILRDREATSEFLRKLASGDERVEIKIPGRPVNGKGPAVLRLKRAG